MSESANKNKQSFMEISGGLALDAISNGRHEGKTVPGGQTMSEPATPLDINRDVGDFFYDLKPARDAGIGLTEQTIDYIVDVKGEPEGLRALRKNVFPFFTRQPLSP